MASHLAGAIVGTFVVGDGTKVGQTTFLPDKPHLTLKGGHYVITVVADLKQVTPLKARMTLAAKSVDVSGQVVIQIHAPLMTLRAKAIRLVTPTKVSIGKARMTMASKHYSLNVSYTIPIGKPKIILKGGAIRRIGKTGLVPTVPVSALLVPTVATTKGLAQTGVYVKVLTPTPNVYV